MKAHQLRNSQFTRITLLLSMLATLGILPAMAFLGEYQTAVTNEPSLISYYTFDQGGAADVYSTNHGTLMGTATVAAGAGGFGQSVLLDGSGRVNLGIVESFAFLDDETGSAEAWVKAGALNGAGCIFANRDGYSRWDIHMNADKGGIGMWNGGTYFPQVTIPNASTNWHHLVVVFADGYYTVYWDGGLAGSLSRPLGYTDFTKSTQIGSTSPYFNNNENWVGQIDEVAIYADALSAEAVGAHYEAFLQGIPPTITEQPKGGVFIAGSAPSLRVSATGPKLGYQWYKGTTLLPGQTTNTLVLPAFSAADAGTYYVRVSNITQIVQSDPATLSVGQLSMALANYQAVVSSETSLLSYYTFDRGNAEDVAGSNEGAMTGTAVVDTGLGGGAAKGLLLDGGGHVNLGTIPDFDFPSGEGTVEGWVRADWTDTSGSTYRCMFANRSGYNPTVWSLHLSPTKSAVTFFNGNASEIWSVPGGAGTSWHHVAVVFDTGGAYASYYWDGALLARRARPLGSGPATVQLGSATPTTSESWIGMLDEVAFYSTALSATQIQAHYNGFVAGEPPTITGQPAGGYFLSGQTVQLSVAATGPQLTYQWYKDNTLIPGATTAVLGPEIVTPDYSGAYYVNVMNPAGNTNSATATVQVGNNIARYQATVVAESSLISYYTFDTGDAQDAKNLHHGTGVGTVAFGSGAGGVTNLSLTLDGNSHIDLGQATEFDFVDGTGTIEGWIRPDWINPAPYDPAVFANRDFDGSVWSVHMDRWKVAMLNFSSGPQSLPVFGGGGWHHYSIVFDAGKVTMYWDGKPLGSFNQSINSSLAKSTQLGSSAPAITSEGWMGGLDEVAFYGDALDANTIWNHFLGMVGAPSLSYSLSGSQLTISWQADLTGFVLEEADGLAAATWTPVSGVVNNQVTVDASVGNKFFRLKK